MKDLGVIPARYQLSMLLVKPIVDICGKPMIWWLYQTVKKNFNLTDVVVDIDDERIVDICNEHGINVSNTI